MCIYSSTTLIVSLQVFLAQLHRRACLLNEGFQTQVLRVIQMHEWHQATCSSTYCAVHTGSVTNQTRSSSGLSGEIISQVVFESSELSETCSKREAIHASGTRILLAGRLHSDSSEAAVSSTEGACTITCRFINDISDVEVHPAPVKT